MHLVAEQLLNKQLIKQQFVQMLGYVTTDTKLGHQVRIAFTMTFYIYHMEKKLTTLNFIQYIQPIHRYNIIVSCNRSFVSDPQPINATIFVLTKDDFCRDKNLNPKLSSRNHIGIISNVCSSNIQVGTYFIKCTEPVRLG